MHAGLAVLIAVLALTGSSGGLLDVTEAPGAPQQTSTPAAPAAPAAAQAAAAAPNAAAPADAAKAPVPENYTYDPGGRRDPFLTLLGGGSDAHVVSKKGDGPAGMTVAEISVRGVMQSRSGLIAMVQGPDNKTYIVHPGDKLLDGAIKSITAQGLVIEQAVNDPLSVVKQREVRKLLRGLEDSK
jgi:Tfp pilus assembly protein PilP